MVIKRTAAKKTARRTTSGKTVAKRKPHPMPWYHLSPRDAKRCFELDVQEGFVNANTNLAKSLRMARGWVKKHVLKH